MKPTKKAFLYAPIIFFFFRYSLNVNTAYQTSVRSVCYPHALQCIRPECTTFGIKRDVKVVYVLRPESSVMKYLHLVEFRNVHGYAHLNISTCLFPVDLRQSEKELAFVPIIDDDHHVSMTTHNPSPVTHMKWLLASSLSNREHIAYLAYHLSISQRRISPIQGNNALLKCISHFKSY